MVFRDAYAVIANPRPGTGAGPGHPLLFTSLRTAAPKVLLNAELGDSAVIEGDVGDRWAQAFGYDLRLHTIRSRSCGEWIAWCGSPTLRWNAKAVASETGSGWRARCASGSQL
jgi:hypothetical protein